MYRAKCLSQICNSDILSRKIKCGCIGAFSTQCIILIRLFWFVVNIETLRLPSLHYGPMPRPIGN